MKKIVSAVRIALLAVLGLSVGTAATSSASIPFGKPSPDAITLVFAQRPRPALVQHRAGPADVLGALGLLLGHAAWINPYE